MTINDIIIIGSGISGMNTAYQLLKHNKNIKILILEKNEYLGGRIKTEIHNVNDHIYKYEAGAGRFNEKHHLLLNLINELDLQKNIIKIGSTIMFYPSSEYNKKYIHQSPFTYIRIVIEKSKKISKEKLQKYTFIEYAKTILPKEDIQFILDSFGYYAQLIKMNAYDAIKLFNDGMNPGLEFYSLNSGMSSIIYKLYEKINKKSKIIMNSNVENIEYNKNDNLFRIYVKNKVYRSKFCIAAIPKPDLLKFSILHKYTPLLQSINTKTLCRIYSIFSKEDIWFKNINKTTTNNNSRYIIPIDKENGLIMISYSDSKFADYWQKLYEKNEKNVIKNLKNNIYKTFSIKINDPIYTKLCYWEVGTAFWKKNKDSSIISKKIIQLDENIPFFICGENYSETQGWVEGALETSNYIVNLLNSRYF